MDVKGIRFAEIYKADSFAKIKEVPDQSVDVILRGRLETGRWGGWPGSDVIPNGVEAFGACHVDADHPAAA